MGDKVNNRCLHLALSFVKQSVRPLTIFFVNGLFD